MNNAEFTGAIALVAVAAGLVGSLTGLGGGVVMTPVLILFGVDLHYAMGATLLSVIATSSGAAAAYVREGLSHVRIAMFLEMATTSGALAGAACVPYVSTRLLSVIFGAVLLFSAWFSRHERTDRPGEAEESGFVRRLGLKGEYIEQGKSGSFAARHVGAGFGMMALAGMISGLLGIGSGAFKVLAMDHVMQIPFKISTATSNFMIGVTAAAGAGLYWRRGYIEPGLAMPVMLGVLAGSMIGAKKLPGTSSTKLRVVFATVIGVLGIEMVYGGLSGRI